MAIEDIKVPQIPVPPEVPTRGLAPPPTTGLTPPVIPIPQWNQPQPPQLPINAPIDYPAPEPEEAPPPKAPENLPKPETVVDEEDKDREMGDDSTEETTDEGLSTDTPDSPDATTPVMAPFDASTEIEVQIPFIEEPVTVPVPKPEVVITAGTTAAVATVGATGAAVFAKPLFDYLVKILKPLLKQAMKKLTGKKEKVYPASVQLQLLDQLRFGTNHQGPLRLHQGKQKHKEKKDDKKSPDESSPHT